MNLPVQKFVLDLAKRAIESFIKNGVTLQTDTEIPLELSDKSSGVFVTIKEGKNLRGCIGTVLESAGYMKDDIVKNAIAAATKDPRFPPVTISELSSLSYSVDVLKKPFKAENISALNPKKYGVMVRKGSRQGLLLPDIDGVNTVYDQLNVACLKAGISLYDNPEVYAFEVIRCGEK